MAQQTSTANAVKATEKVWFITGASRGFGRIWTEAALQRGDKVVATARKPESIADLKEKYGTSILTLAVDVTDADQVKTAVEEGYRHFGRLDVILNNAGYSLVSTIEEAHADDVRQLYETNILGPVSVIQAALPLLRQQGHGHLVGVSSSLGLVSYPVIGYYCSSKWAFEALYESLAAEVRQFGIDVTIIEPGAYATEFGSQQSLKFSESLPIYNELKGQLFENLQQQEKGDPTATPDAIFAVVDNPNPPLRLFLGSHNLPEVSEAYAARLQTWEAWKTISNAAQG